MGEKCKMSYSNAKIYCIRNSITEDIYVGHTTQALSKRMEKHRSDFKKRKSVLPKLHEHFEEYGIENFYIEKITDCQNCQDVEDVRKIEGEYIRKMGTLNKCIAGRTNEEYREDNAEQIKETKRLHYENNKEYYKQKNQENYYNKIDEIKETQKNYYQNHKDEYYERNQTYREENPEKVKQYQKEYVENNQKQIQSYQENYREINKDKLKEWKNTKVECECGGRYTLSHKAEHFKSQRHQNFLNNQ